MRGPLKRLALMLIHSVVRKLVIVLRVCAINVIAKPRIPGMAPFTYSVKLLMCLFKPTFVSYS